MSQITIDLPEDQVRELKSRAAELGVSLEDLLRVSVEDLLAQTDEAFRGAVDRVLNKNKELYRRLA